MAGGKKSRTKGAAGENEVIKLMRFAFPDAARELDQYQEKLGRDIKGTQPWCFQVKRHRKLSEGDLRRAFMQADSVPPESGYSLPAVLYREDRGSWRAFTTVASIIEWSGWSSSPADDTVFVDMDAAEFFTWLKS